MRLTLSFSFLFLALSIIPCHAAHDGGIEHHADTAGDHPVPLAGHLELTDPNDLIILRHGPTVRIPYAKIRSLSYCGETEPAELARSQAPLRRLLTIGYLDMAGTNHNLVVQMPAKRLEATLRDLEDQTGFKIGSEPRPAEEWRHLRAVQSSISLR